VRGRSARAPGARGLHSWLPVSLPQPTTRGERAGLWRPAGGRWTGLQRTAGGRWTGRQRTDHLLPQLAPPECTCLQLCSPRGLCRQAGNPQGEKIKGTVPGDGKIRHVRAILAPL
jgi:hypothetical protein